MALSKAEEQGRPLFLYLYSFWISAAKEGDLGKKKKKALKAGEEAQRLSGWLQGPAGVCLQAELPTGRGEHPKKSGVCRKPLGQLMARPIPALRLQPAAPTPSLWHRLLYLALACLQRQAGVSLPRELLTFVGVALPPETEIL